MEENNGLYPVFGTNNPQRLADVVFVHGLDGGAYSTWRADDRQENFWPRWLGDDVPQAGIWTLGYTAAASDWTGASMPLTERARNVQDQLQLAGVGRRPLVFVCHSLGGLLVKQWLRHVIDAGTVPSGRGDIARSIRAIVFLATPHAGSSSAGLLTKFSWLIRASVTVQELVARHPSLRELNVWYREQAPRLALETRVYYEKKPTKGILEGVQEAQRDSAERCTTTPA